MNLENQVCNLKLAKKLKELGVIQNSLYAYMKSEFGIIDGKEYINKIILTFSEISNSSDKWSSFTSSELMNLLPNRVNLFEPNAEPPEEINPYNSFTLIIKKSFIVKNNDLELIPTYIINYECDTTACTGEDAWLRRTLFSNIWDENFSNALAKTLIHLYELGYFKNAPIL